MAIVSAIWVLGAGTVSVGLIREVSAPILLHDGEQSLSFPANTPIPNVRKAVLEYLREKFDPSTAQPVGPSARGFDPDAYLAGRAQPLKAPRVLDQLDNDRANAIIGDYRPTAYAPVIMELAALILLSPLVLMALGIAAFWTISGFRPQNTGEG